MSHCCNHNAHKTHLDPVCGMSVDPNNAKASSEYQNKTYYFCCPGCQKKFDADPEKYLVAAEQKAQTSNDGSSIDPVCGMTVTPDNAAGTAEHQGHTYLFCSTHCHKKFVADPEGVLNKTSQPVQGNADDDYTCPMHPEVINKGPGDCPKCGMALEPMAPTLEDDGEADKIKRRFITLALLTLPIFIYDMGGHLFNINWQHPVADWAEAILATLVVLWGGAPFFRRAWQSIYPFSPNMYTLVAMGTGVAWVYSMVAIAFPHIFPATFLNEMGKPDLYFEAAAVIVTLVMMGDWLELNARKKSSDELKGLLELAPETAWLIDPNGQAKEVSLDNLNVGDKVLVKPGSRIPQDGIVVDGSSLVDESMLSGEAIPVAKKIGDSVTGATFNQQGTLTIKITRTGEDSFLSQLISQVLEARRSRAPIQKLVDKVSSIFVPSVIAASLLAFIVWAAFDAPLSHALLAAIAVLIVACPCALGLATPISIMVATGRGASMGVLFKDASAIQALSKVDTIILDKTGTLTEGKPHLTHTLVSPNSLISDKNLLLQLAASLESKSEHPLAQVFVSLAKGQGLELLPVDNFASFTGKGVKGKVGDYKLTLGGERFMQECGFTLSDDLRNQATEQQKLGASTIYFAVNNQFAAIWVVKDPIKDQAKATLDALQKDGVTLIMASGDQVDTAKAVGQWLGLTQIYGAMLPSDKLELVQRLKAEGKMVAMVGDGINDASALAAADVGIAMGQGADIAIQNAQVTLATSEPAAIRRAWLLAKAGQKNIKQNLWFAFMYNSLGVPVAAGVLYPFFGILLSPAFAALAMSLSSVSVITNSLRLRKVKL